MGGVAPASSVRERSGGTGSPVLARFAGLAAVGLLAARLPRRAWRRTPGLDLLLAAGGPLLLVGVALGWGIQLLDPPALRPLPPLTPPPPGLVRGPLPGPLLLRRFW